MRRRHTREQYLELVSALKAAVPGVQVSTDMIVGFPGETDEDFADTLSLVESAGFHSMFSFKYSERPGTLAAKRLPDDVPEVEKDRRLAALQQLQKGIQTRLHEALVGLTVEVLVDSVSRRRDTELSGRTSGNTVVNFPGYPGLLGSLAQVDVERAGPHSLWGRARALTAPEASPTL
jgi:tRNA-2-methylthio-N6-dimethylallyladenosine synthase